MPHILVIEDDHDVRDLLRQLFKEEGCEVTVLPDGTDAMKLYREEMPDVVITDILMPHNEGILTIFGLRREFPGAKIVAVSGGGHFEASHYLDMASKIGADRVLAKPFQPGEIIGLVRELLEKVDSGSSVRVTRLGRAPGDEMMAPSGESPPATAAQDARSAGEGGTSKARILVVDDDDDIRDSLQEILEEHGYEVAAVADGKEAIRLFRRKAADLVILDILMPVKEGIETLLELRRDFPHLKILAISGGGLFGSDDYLASAALFGADRTLAKPFGPDTFLELVGELTRL